MIGKRVAILVVSAATVAGCGSSSNDDKPARSTAATTTQAAATPTQTPTATATPAVAPPPTAKIKDLKVAAKQARCTLRTNLPDEGRDHEDKDFVPADYKTNPPTSGNHAPSYPDDGVFAPGQEAQLGQMVHLLEHGRIWIQYKKNATTPARIAQLTKLRDSLQGGYHSILSENMTSMPYAIAATAWHQLLGCNTTNGASYDAIRAFYKRYVDKGPELIP